MGRALKEVSIDDLRSKILRCEENKKKILSRINDLKNKVLAREISYSEYEELLEQKLQGKTFQEWLDFYQDYIKNCEELIQKKNNKKIAKKVLAYSSIIFIIAGLFALFFYLSPVLVGFLVKAPVQEFTQPVNLNFNQSQDYELQLEHQGILESLKISGYILNQGNVKVYLDDLLILDSNNIKQKAKLTGLTIEGEETSSPSQETSPSPETSETSTLQESTSEQTPTQEAPQTEESPSQEALPETQEETPEIPQEPEENITETPTTPQPEENITLPENITEENVTAPITEQPPEQPEEIPEENITQIEFIDICEETCKNLNLNKSSYTLRIEITNSELNLKEIKYEITTEIAVENITIPENATPVLIKDIPDINIQKNKQASIDLSEYFQYAEKYSVLQTENILTTIQNNKLKITPEKDFTGERESEITAINNFGEIKSNSFKIAVSEVPEEIENITQVNFTETTFQYKAVIGKPVKWIKNISLEKPGIVIVDLPKEAENITVKKIKETPTQESATEESSEIPTQEAPQTEESPSQEALPESQEEAPETPEENITLEPANSLITGQVISKPPTNFLKNLFSRLTGRAITTQEQEENIQVTIEDNASKYIIEYETPAPQSYEENTAKGKKIIISAPTELNYTDVLAFTELPTETPEEKIRLYWLKEEKVNITDENNKTIEETQKTRELVNIKVYDTNNNSLVDYIEWIVPHLSNQTYELIIEISKAEHLDSSRQFISDIYQEVKALDDLWSEDIPANDYIRVTFEANLTSENDITLYPRIISGTPKIQVYKLDSQELIAEFENLAENEYNKVLLTNLQGEQETFDLKVIQGTVEIDYIVDPWANTTFNKCMNITISSAVSSTLINFPIYINLTKKDEMLSDYSDLRFYNASCENDGVLLAHEIEGYTADNADIWVKIPSLPSTGAIISVYYSNNSAVDSAENATGVWDINFQAVYHLKEEVAGTGNADAYNDSSGYNYDADDYVSDTGQTGVVYYGKTFDGSDSIRTGLSAEVDDLFADTGNVWTVSVWFLESGNPSADEVIIGRGGGTASSATYALYEESGQSDKVSTDIRGTYTYTINKADSNWHYAATTWDGTTTTGKIIVDGVEYAMNSGSKTLQSNTIMIGATATGTSSYFSGSIDEVRLSDTARSTDWENMSYQIVANQGTYVSFGSEETQPSEDTEYPQFYNYTDNNGTLIGTGTATFSVNINNTNGTAGIEFNYTNYTSFNSTDNLFNVTVETANSGLYNYYWWAYGNGTSTNYNYSEARSYTVNEGDSTPPDVTIIFPQNTTYFRLLDLPFIFNVSLNENGTANYTLDNGIANVTMNTTDNVNFTGTLDILEDGDYIFQVYANDTAGNSNYTENISFSLITSNTLVNGTIYNASGDATYTTFAIIDEATSNEVYNETDTEHEAIVPANTTYTIEIIPHDIESVDKIELNGVNLSDYVGEEAGILNLDEPEDTGNFSTLFALDLQMKNFTTGTLTFNATSNTLFKCSEWNFTEQVCKGNWTLLMRGLTPGEQYEISIEPGDPGYAQIDITKAIHLDENKTFISDIYEAVRYFDELWSEEIPSGHYVRTTFEENLTSENDITLYPRTVSGTPKIEVYELDGEEKLAEFSSLTDNEYNKIYLTNLSGEQDTFDLRVIDGSVEINHIVDPWAFANGTGLSTDLQVQRCTKKNASSYAKWITTCNGTYPSDACPAGGGADLLACQDSQIESMWFNSTSGSGYGGINVTTFNNTITDCKRIIQVFICYDMWATTNMTTCALRISSIGTQASFVNATSTISNVNCSTGEAGSNNLVASANASTGIKCINVTANFTGGSGWNCSNFFGPAATGAYLQFYGKAKRVGSTMQTLRIDALYFNVSYSNDSFPPYFSEIVTNTLGINDSQALRIQYNATDNEDLSDGNWTVNWTTNFTINGSLGSGSPTSSQANLTNSSQVYKGIYMINITINDSVNNLNSTILTITVNATPPYFTLIPGAATINYSNSSAGISADFDATDESGIASVNFSVNDTKFAINSSGYLTNASATYLAVQDWYVNVTINDTLGNLNSTIYQITVNKEQGNITLHINGTRENFTTDNSSTTLNIWLNATNITGEGDVAIIVNGTLYNNGTSPQANLTNLSAGLYNITAYSAATQNFTSAQEIWWVNITIIPPLIALDLIYPTAENVTSGLNVTQNKFFNVTVNVSCSEADCGDINISLDPVMKKTYYPNTTNSLAWYGGHFATPVTLGKFRDGTTDTAYDSLQRNQTSVDDANYVWAGTHGTLDNSCQGRTQTTDCSLLSEAQCPNYYDADEYACRTPEPDVCIQGEICWMFPGHEIQFKIAEDKTMIGNISIRVVSYGDYYNDGVLRRLAVYNWTSSSYVEYDTDACTDGGGPPANIECNLTALITDPLNFINSTGYLDVILYDSSEAPPQTVRNYYAEAQVNSTKGLISIVEGETPFYTNVSNPNTTSLNEGQSAIVVFWVNATGFAEGTYEFFAYANITSNQAISNITSKWNVTILPVPTNTPPQINYIQNSTLTGAIVTPAIASYTPIKFNLTVYDEDGAANINTASVKANFTANATGEATRENSSCSEIAGETTDNSLNFSCTVDMWYFDKNISWNITVYAEDDSAESAQNRTATFDYSSLTAVIISPDVITFNVEIGALNKTSLLNTTLNNTGNVIITSGKISVNATNLRGMDDITKFFNAGNFTASWNGTNPGAGGVCNNASTGSGTRLVSNVSTGIAGANLTRGNVTLGTGIGQEVLYYCIPKVPQLASQTYATNQSGAWIIKIALVLISTPSLRRKKKKIARDNNLVKALNLISKEQLEEYSKEKEELISILIKEIKKKFRINNKQLAELIEVRKEVNIPATIFVKEVGVLETLVRYMKENLSMNYHEIALLLDRNERTIWTAYNKAKKKQKKSIKPKETQIFIPISIFKDRKLTILESAIIYLKEQKLRFSEIAKLLDREQRNIYTIYSRAISKIKRKV